MESNSSLNPTVTDVLTLIDQARNAEMYREITKLQEILQPVWDNIGEYPDYEKYDLPVKAELLRLSGAFLTLYAGAKGLKDIQLKAKNLLTRAIEIFDDLELPEKSAESNLWLGFAYGNCGETNEYEAVYDYLENQFGNASPRVAFLAAINRLVICVYNNQIIEGKKLIEHYLPAFDLCLDSRLKVMFYNNAGIIYRRAGKLASAVNFYHTAIELVKDLNISEFEARTYNNLAYLYKDQKEFKKAHECADKSLQLFLSGGNENGIPIILDTKAIIYLDEERYDEAFQAVESALVYFIAGEDYNQLTDALWTKILCLFRLERNVEAYIEFVKLQNIAAERIGEVAVKKFAALFDQEVYIPQPLPLPAKIGAFKKHCVKKGLIQSGLKITKAAKKLGLKHHENLRDILLNQFPEIYDEIGMARPKKRLPKKLRPPGEIRTVKIYQPPSRTVVLRPEDIHEEKVISRLYFENADFSFDFNYSSDSMETFYFNRDLMKEFGVDSNAIVAVAPLAEIKTGTTVLIKNENEFVVGRIEQDSLSKVYFVAYKMEWIPVDETNVVGVPVGYSAGPASKGLIEFTRLKIT